MSLLGVLGGIGRNVSEFADERKQEQRQQLLDEERKRKERMDMLARFMGMIKDPQGQAELFRRSQQGEDIMGMLPSILDRQAQQQAQQQRQQEQQQRESSELDDFVTGATGANISGTQDKFTEQLTEEQARRLGRSGQTGQGLDTLIRMRNEVGQRGMAGQDAQKQQQEQDMIDKIASAKDIDALRSLRAVAKPQFGEGSRVLKMIDERMDAGFGMPEAPTGGDLTAEEQKRQKLFTVLDTDVNALLGVIDEPRVKDVLGTSGTWNQFRQDNPTLSNAISPVVGEIPRTFTAVQGVISGIAEKYLRLLTGAAAQDAEVIRIANRQVGNVRMSPETLKTLLMTFKNSLRTELDTLAGETLTPAQAELRLANLLDSINGSQEQQGNAPDNDIQSLQYDPQMGWK
jgi:hypothetical protein